MSPQPAHECLVKVSVFHHGLTHFFATHGVGADTERARWVADATQLKENKESSQTLPLQDQADQADQRL